MLEFFNEIYNDYKFLKRLENNFYSNNRYIIVQDIGFKILI